MEIKAEEINRANRDRATAHPTGKNERRRKELEEMRRIELEKLEQSVKLN